MTQTRNIFLVGFMASGKSSVGRTLARLTGWPLIDADDEIVRRAGKPIDQIFQDSGEPAFRELERTAVRDLCQGENRIIAAGGGAFVDEENRSWMLKSGTVFCLTAAPETIYRRITGGRADAPVRPMLAGDDPLQRIKDLLDQRASAYAQAHHTIETDELTQYQIAERIIHSCGLEASPAGG